jgi:hypothetical protein
MVVQMILFPSLVGIDWTDTVFLCEHFGFEMVADLSVFYVLWLVIMSRHYPRGRPWTVYITLCCILNEDSCRL